MEASRPSLERLTALYQFLDSPGGREQTALSSQRLAEILGTTGATIRRDLSLLNLGSPGAAYNRDRLQEALERFLGLQTARDAVIVGLGRLGQSLLHFEGWENQPIRLRAGFDIDTNLLEILDSPVPLYPSYRIPEILGRLESPLALLTVSPQGALLSAQRLAEGGVKGIVNFTGISLEGLDSSIQVRDVSVLRELMALAALSQR